MTSFYRFTIILVTGIAIAVLPACASARNAVSKNDNTSVPAFANASLRDAVVDSIISGYSDWGTVELNGKVQMEGLPLSPSVRIYMKKGSDIMISARAPFIGEAFRIDVTGDSILMVNKLNKTYCRESAAGLSKLYPEAAADMQSLLLGRIVVPGEGELSRRNASKINVAPDDEGSWMIEPDLSSLPVDAVMGYFVSPEGELQALAAALNENNIVAVGYQWRGNYVRTMEFSIERKGKTRSVTLTLDTPKWGAQPLQQMKINSRFRRVGIKDFVRSVGLK